MSAAATRGLTLDTGALLALDHPGKTRAMRARLEEVRRNGGSICIPVGVVARSWRGRRQVRLAQLITSADIDFATMSLSDARLAGRLCALTGHADVIDVHIALCARARRHAVVTSDPDEIARVDPGLPIIRV